MKAYETVATVQDPGEVRVAGVPFAPGTEVEVTISPRRRAAEEFVAAWQLVCTQLRERPGLETISDDEIRDEIDRYRTGQ